MFGGIDGGASKSLSPPDMRCYITNGSGLTSVQTAGRPDPGTAGPGDVRIRVEAVSLNYRDLMVADGRYGGAMDPPILCASDMAGTVNEEDA